jgi:hypothetical protein
VFGDQRRKPLDRFEITRDSAGNIRQHCAIILLNAAAV